MEYCCHACKRFDKPNMMLINHHYYCDDCIDLPTKQMTAVYMNLGDGLVIEFCRCQDSQKAQYICDSLHKDLKQSFFVKSFK